MAEPTSTMAEAVEIKITDTSTDDIPEEIEKVKDDCTGSDTVSDFTTFDDDASSECFDACYDTLYKQIKELKAENTKLDERRREHEQNHIMQQEEVTQLKETISDLRQAAQFSTAEEMRMKEEREKAEQQIKTLTASVQQITEAKQKRDAEYDTVKKEAIDICLSTVELAKKVDDVSSKIEQLKSENNSLKATVVAQTVKRDEIIDDSNSTITSLKEQLATLVKTNCDLNKQISDTQHTNQQLMLQVASREKYIFDTEKELKEIILSTRKCSEDFEQVLFDKKNLLVKLTEHKSELEKSRVDLSLVIKKHSELCDNYQTLKDQYGDEIANGCTFENKVNLLENKIARQSYDLVVQVTNNQALVAEKEKLELCITTMEETFGEQIAIHTKKYQELEKKYALAIKKYKKYKAFSKCLEETTGYHKAE